MLNTPFLFVNGALNYDLADVFRANDRISVFWNTRYVHEYFLAWESISRIASIYNDKVPSQTTHSAGVTYRTNIKKLQQAFTIDIQNLTNAKVFDFFGVQRPGRAFYLKLTTQF